VRFRRRRSSRPRTAKSRKSYWLGGMFHHNEFIGNTTALNNGGFAGECYTWWLKWPSGQRSLTNDIEMPEEIEPVDETLMKTEMIVGLQATCSNFPGNNREAYTLGIGVTVKDPGSDPFSLNSVFTTFDTTNDDYPPFPLPVFQQDEDWIYRLIMTGTQGNEIWSSTAGGDVRAMSSRARRKLPPGSGILGILQMTDIAQSAVQDWTYQLALDWRLLLKAGAYSPGA